jgi:hypothetical protein
MILSFIFYLNFMIDLFISIHIYTASTFEINILLSHTFCYLLLIAVSVCKFSFHLALIADTWCWTGRCSLVLCCSCVWYAAAVASRRLANLRPTPQARTGCRTTSWPLQMKRNSRATAKLNKESTRWMWVHSEAPRAYATSITYLSRGLLEKRIN